VPDNGGDVRGLFCGAVADVAGGGDGDGHGAERHGRGVRDEHDGRRTQRWNAQRENHRRGDGDRGTEASEGFKQASEAEGNEHGLDAHIAVAHLVEDEPQIFEAAGGYRDLVEPDRREDHEDDGDKAVDTAAEDRRNGHHDRHVESEDAHDERHQQCGGAGRVRPGFQPKQQHKERHQREGG